MTALAWLVPMALFLGLVGLGAFLWSLKAGQMEDLEGAAWRALEEDPALEPALAKRPSAPGDSHARDRAR
jgi:cbb3-type cytochrome oxidase maturation protein